MGSGEIEKWRQGKKNSWANRKTSRRRKHSEPRSTAASSITYSTDEADLKDHDPAQEQGKGPQGFIAFFTKFREAFPELEVAVKPMVADEENVAIAYSITGTHERDFQGIAPTERTSKRAGCRSPASRMAGSRSDGQLGRARDSQAAGARIRLQPDRASG
ncbi:MAG: ester cyclase [Verrucomicrobiota bacterium]|nr:ester cyclase [Verrucomicrobiota bacterium]